MPQLIIALLMKSVSLKGVFMLKAGRWISQMWPSYHFAIYLFVFNLQHSDSLNGLGVHRNELF